MAITWDEARAKMQAFKDNAWTRRVQEVQDGTMECPRCQDAVESFQQIQEWEWDGVEFQPIMESALAHEGYCESCDVWLYSPYGIIFIGESGCHHCHEPLPTNAYLHEDCKEYCDEECAEEHTKDPLE